MPEKERIAFEQQIATDKALAALVEETKFTNEAIYMANLSIIKERVGADIKKITYQPASNLGKYLFMLSLGLITTGVATYLLYDQPESKQTKPSIVKHEQPSEVAVNQKLTDTIDQTTTATPSSDQPVQPVAGKTKSAEPVVKTAPNFNQPIEKNNALMDTTKPIITKKQEKLPVAAVSTPDPVSVVDSKTPAQKDSPPNDCVKNFNLQTAASCKEKATGVITITSNKTTPQQVELDGITQDFRPTFRAIASGKHTLLIRYNSTCAFEETVVVADKWCPRNNSYSFNPEYGEQWELLYDDGDEGNLVIFSSDGKEIYQHAFGTGPVYWNGADNQGVMAPIGTYVALIYYSDGRKEKVDLTIVR